MKGVINKGIQELVESRFGPNAWQNIKRRAGCEEPFFAASESYPDETTLALIQATSEVSGRPVETVEVEFGKFWVPNTGRACYPTLYHLAGSSAREFLLDMNRVHAQVTRSLWNSLPPKFTYEDLPDGTLLMHYDSKRGLCAVLRGLVIGLGILFGQELEVREVGCARKGNPLSTMEVTFK